MHRMSVFTVKKGENKSHLCDAWHEFAKKANTEMHNNPSSVFQDGCAWCIGCRHLSVFLFLCWFQGPVPAVTLFWWILSHRMYGLTAETKFPWEHAASSQPTYSVSVNQQTAFPYLPSKKGKTKATCVMHGMNLPKRQDILCRRHMKGFLKNPQEMIFGIACCPSQLIQV